MGDHPLRPTSRFGASKKGGETSRRQSFGAERHCPAPKLVVLSGLETSASGGQVVLYRWAISAEYEGHEFVGATGGLGEQLFCSKAIFHLFGGHGDECGEVVDPT